MLLKQSAVLFTICQKQKNIDILCLNRKNIVYKETNMELIKLPVWIRYKAYSITDARNMVWKWFTFILKDIELNLVDLWLQAVNVTRVHRVRTTMNLLRATCLQDYNLSSHKTNVVCANFVRKMWLQAVNVTRPHSIHYNEPIGSYMHTGLQPILAQS